MTGEMTTVAKAASAEFTEKRSVFIGHTASVSDVAAAEAFIASVKKKYSDARHNVWAYLLRDGSMRYSDDGEPQGTAGQPMLAVLEREHILDAVCIVTRYFGGVLLGAGGLTRAYARGAKDALTAAGVACNRVWDSTEILCPYALLEQVKLRIAARGGVLEGTDFGADVTVRALLPQGALEALGQDVRELSAGRVAPRLVEQVYRAVRV